MGLQYIYISHLMNIICPLRELAMASEDKCESVSEKKTESVSELQIESGTKKITETTSEKKTQVISRTPSKTESNRQNAF